MKYLCHESNTFGFSYCAVSQLKLAWVTLKCVNIWGQFDFFFFFLEYINTFIQQGHIKQNKSYSKDIYNVTKDVCFKSLLFLLTFYSSVNPEKIKYITVSIKIFCSTTVFNTDNNQKCFLSSKSVYYYDFWRSCDIEDWSNDAENTAAHHRNKLYLIIYSHRKQLF